MSASLLHVVLLVLLACVSALQVGGSSSTRTCQLAALQLNGRLAPPVYRGSHSYYYDIADTDLGKPTVGVDALVSVAADSPSDANALVQVDYFILFGAFGLLTRGENVAAGDNAALASGQLGLSFSGAVKLRQNLLNVNTNIIMKITRGGCRTQIYLIHVRGKRVDQPPSLPAPPVTQPSKLCTASSVSLSLVSGQSASPSAWALTPAFDSSVRKYTFASAALVGAVSFVVRVKAPADAAVIVGVNGDDFVSLSSSAPAASSGGLVEYSGEFRALVVDASTGLDVAVIVSGPACDTSEYLIGMEGSDQGVPTDPTIPAPSPVPVPVPTPTDPSTPPIGGGGGSGDGDSSPGSGVPDAGNGEGSVPVEETPIGGDPTLPGTPPTNSGPLIPGDNGQIGTDPTLGEGSLNAATPSHAWSLATTMLVAAVAVTMAQRMH